MITSSGPPSGCRELKTTRVTPQPVVIGGECRNPRLTTIILAPGHSQSD